MKTIKITTAANKSLIGKYIVFNENTGIALMGKKEYRIGFDVHQPNKANGDYSVIDYKLEDLKPIILYRTDSDHQNKGVHIQNYSLN